MLLRKQDVAQTAFEDKNNFRNETLFFLHDPNFYYTRLPNFRKVFQTLVLKLNIIRPKLLQSEKTIWGNAKNERKKIDVMEKAIKLGEFLIRENRDKLFKSKTQPNKALAHFFHINVESSEYFTNEILYPLLRLVDTIDDNKWERLPNKRGFWRELQNEEPMPVGGEVSLNLTTGKKMLKL